MSDNPFEKLEKMYQEEVDKQDEKGFSELYKKATEGIFKEIEKNVKFNAHFSDVQYLDGYFIFGFGTNSIVHFHIDECPGWLFGIWWEPIELEEMNDNEPVYAKDRLRCSLFIQYESEIDKFKPSASLFGEEFDYYYLTGSSSFSAIKAYKEIDFIHKEPYLAFYKEMRYVDFNLEYVDKRKAKRFYESYFKRKELEKTLNEQFDKEILDTLERILKPVIDDDLCFVCEIACLSPRYSIVMKDLCPDAPDPENRWAGHRCYLFEIGYEDAEDDKKLYNDKLEELDKRAQKNKIHWCDPISTLVDFFSEEDYNKLKKGYLEEGSLVLYKKEYKSWI